MSDADLKTLVEYVLLWIGFGTVVGLTAKAVMPGRDPGGSIATLLMGIGGTLIGCGIYKLIKPEIDVSPMSGFGFFVGTAGALMVLALYKVLGGYWFREGEHVSRGHIYRRRRRRYHSSSYDY
jgi:uncharacterized membrane protein YeaQ/YmgE (transglycosylase-associated protein family)